MVTSEEAAAQGNTKQHNHQVYTKKNAAQRQLSELNAYSCVHTCAQMCTDVHTCAHMCTNVHKCPQMSTTSIHGMPENLWQNVAQALAVLEAAARPGPASRDQTLGIRVISGIVYSVISQYSHWSSQSHLRVISVSVSLAFAEGSSIATVSGHSGWQRPSCDSNLSWGSAVAMTTLLAPSTSSFHTRNRTPSENRCVISVETRHATHA